MYFAPIKSPGTHAGTNVRLVIGIVRVSTAAHFDLRRAHVISFYRAADRRHIVRPAPPLSIYEDRSKTALYLGRESSRTGQNSEERRSFSASLIDRLD